MLPEPEASDERKNNQTEDENGNRQTAKSVDSSLALTRINSGYQVWRNVLRSSRLILAPMVDQSELAFRMLARSFGAQCTFSPMFNANVFVNSAKYRQGCLQVAPELDRPFIIQV